jgi:capsular exopolysaccharide synthesis family protein
VHEDAVRVRDESFRLVRSQLLVMLADLNNPTVVVTSSLADEGKTATCAALAVSLARAGRRVVAVDVDLRHPNLHARFGAHNEVGLSNVLLDQILLEDALQYVELEDEGQGLYFLATGSETKNPTELLGTARIARLLDVLSSQADVLLLDTPPVLPVADTLVIGRMAAGAILVVESRSTPVPSVMQAKDALTRNQTRLLGVVLNKVQPRDLTTTIGYGYAYGDGDGDGDGSRADGGA